MLHSEAYTFVPCLLDTVPDGRGNPVAFVLYVPRGAGTAFLGAPPWRVRIPVADTLEMLRTNVEFMTS